MPVPDYQTLMLPVLQFAADGEVHTGAETVEHVAAQFKLSAADRLEVLPSGRTRLVNNRTHWALTYLRHAGLLGSEGHGKYRITDRGRALLATKPPRIDKALLVERYPEIVDFIGGARARSTAQVPHEAGEEQALSPEEQVESSYRALRMEVEHQLLDRLREGSPTFFEKAAIRVVVALGYGGSLAEAEHVGRSGDGGIDGVINEDKLGLDKVYIQAKRWEGSVGIKPVREFVGSLEKEHARKGIIITTSTFVAEAQRYVDAIEKRIVLIDGPSLARFMVDHGVAVEAKGTFTIYRVDDDFFEEAD